ncbi:A/G-specific DNA glycosylase [Candidatus Sulfotelmatobacter sp. SbA7]|nr:A/G-specific DNA glycosylase [Candidatus Sulfotelmatobacter sp. SbA7]
MPPTKSSDRGRFRRLLLKWFDESKRDLPWRKDRDPYRVWLSEIMLQQTRVAAVVDHYERFLERFPSLEKLAKAREASVLAAWSGLGYYRRARMLHAAAKRVVKEHSSSFPPTAAQLRQLPGIGRYTSAAIASIAFDEPVAVVDGNVERVLQRVSGKRLAGESLWCAAQEKLSPNRPGDFNQAMMELGATLCVPRHPKCSLCPVSRMCATRGELPAPPRPARQKKREINYALNRRNGSVFLVKRPATVSLMPGMWELPEITGKGDQAKACLTLRHSITVTDYSVRVTRGAATAGTPGRWVSKPHLSTLPLTGLARKILRATKVI